MNKLNIVILVVLALQLSACMTGDGGEGIVHGRLDYAGMDISSHQGLVDWDRVTVDENLRFVYIKATEGATYHSPHYDHNARHAREHGLLVGSYHYFSPGSSVESQVDNFTRHVDASTQDLLPMLDVEERAGLTRAQLLDSVRQVVTRLEAVYGKKPIIYSTMDFYNTYLAPQFNDYMLYIGRYANIEPEICWEGDYAVWQFTEDGRVSGISHPVDLCRLNPHVSIDDLRLR